MSITVCLAPAHTIDYPNGGGHFWVYLQWALALRALGCRVIWLEAVDPGEPAGTLQQKLGALRGHLRPYGLSDALALCPLGDTPLPRELSADVPGLDDAAAADLLINLWHSLPPTIVTRFRHSAFVDTDPGLLQIWMATGDIHLAPHHTYFTIGETVGTAAAGFPDCGLPWLYTPPPVFLPEWPALPANGASAYTTVAHWWGGTFEFEGRTLCNEKRVAFLEYLSLPSRTAVKLELAVCLAEYRELYRNLLEPAGWRVREAWDVSATPDDYRRYVQRSRGEFSCAKPAYVTLGTAWISDRTLCYLASGKPAVVQHTGASRFLPDAEGLFRFRTLEEAARVLEAVEADYDHHCRQARLLAEEFFDAQHVIQRVLERALV